MLFIKACAPVRSEMGREANFGAPFIGAPSFSYYPIGMPRYSADRDRAMIITLFAQSKTGLLHYYTLHDRQLSLGQPYALTAAWRAENARERERLYVFSSARERDGKLKTLFRSSLRRGYRLLYSFDREGFGRFGLESAKEVGVYGQADAREG